MHFSIRMPRNAAAQSVPVQLRRGLAYIHYAEGLAQYQRTFDIRVQNIAYAKQVFVHHLKTDGTWTDLPASYVRPLDAGYELWQATFSQIGGGLGDQLVVGSTVNGTTAWDNNHGANYVLHDQDGTLLGPGLHVDAFSAFVETTGAGHSLHVDIDVRNLAYQKTVEVVYTTDSWQTTTTVHARFVSSYRYGYATVVSPNALGVERWVVTTPVPTTASLRFYVQYTVNGQTYYANNGGANVSAAGNGQDGYLM